MDVVDEHSAKAQTKKTKKNETTSKNGKRTKTLGLSISPLAWSALNFSFVCTLISVQPDHCTCVAHNNSITIRSDCRRALCNVHAPCAPWLAQMHLSLGRYPSSFAPNNGCAHLAEAACLDKKKSFRLGSYVCQNILSIGQFHQFSPELTGFGPSLTDAQRAPAMIIHFVFSLDRFVGRIRRLVGHTS